MFHGDVSEVILFGLTSSVYIRWISRKSACLSSYFHPHSCRGDESVRATPVRGLTNIRAFIDSGSGRGGTLWIYRGAIRLISKSQEGVLIRFPSSLRFWQYNSSLQVGLCTSASSSKFKRSSITALKDSSLNLRLAAILVRCSYL
jgi:hypothetical protein